MSKNYQIISKNELEYYMQDNNLEFSLNIIEERPVDIERTYKLLSSYLKPTNWADASKLKYNWWQRKIFQRNKKVIDFLQENEISEVQIAEIENIMQKYSINFNLNEKFFHLHQPIQHILHFIVLSQKHKKIFMKACGFYLGLIMVFFHFLNKFLDSDGKCILVRNTHFQIIEECFKSYLSIVENGNEKLKVWYFDTTLSLPSFK